MRYRGYVLENMKNGLIMCVPFNYSHYGEASALYTPDRGMHEVPALALINKWNRRSPDFKYWLGDGEL